MRQRFVVEPEARPLGVAPGWKAKSMITVWGGQASRSTRAVCVAEEMGLPYGVRHVAMLAAEKDPAWLAVSPGEFLPAIQDSDVNR